MRVVTTVILVAGLAVLCTACGGSSDEAGSPKKGADVRTDGGKRAPRERVTLRTPAGNVAVETDVDFSALEVDVYPGARLEDAARGLTRIETNDFSSVSGSFRSDASREDIVAFYRKRLEGAVFVSSNEGSVISADKGDGVTVQVVVSDDSNSGQRELLISTTRTE